MLTACADHNSTEPEVLSEQICFSIPVAQSTTKTPITDLAQIQNSATTSVFVYGKRGANQINGTYYEGGQIFYAATGIWSLASGTTTWIAGATYNFWGWAYSPTTAEGNGLTIANNGETITVEQPALYSANGTIDYLLARQFPATATSSTPIRGPIVTLELEHAMAMVEIYVTKNPELFSVTVSNITVSNIYKEGVLTCSNHAIYGDGATNQWGTAASDTQDGSYSLTGSLAATDDRTTTPAVMKFIAIPQQLINTTTLTIECSVVEQDGATPKTISRTFQLYKYGNFTVAQRNIYSLVVDTSIELQATIKEWPAVSYVNGTILPEIK